MHVMPRADSVTQRESWRKRLGSVELAFCFGFPYADFVGCGAVCRGVRGEIRAADAPWMHFGVLNAQESRFVQDTLPAAELYWRPNVCGGGRRGASGHAGQSGGAGM